MSRLSSAQLLAGLQQIGTGASPKHTTPAFLAFTARHADLCDVSPLQHYPYLQSVDLSHNALESLAVLSACSSLRSLDASHNALTSLLDFAPPRALRCVNYSHNNIAGQLNVDSLLQNKYIEKLDVSVNRIEGLGAIGQLAHLRELDVSRNQLTSLSEVSNPALVTLNAGGNFIKELSSLPVRALASSLRTLMLDANQITDLAGVERLSLLTVLSLRDNQIDALEELSRLAVCEQLAEIDLRGNPIAEGGVQYRQQLLHVLPHLHKLDGVEVTALEVVEAHNAVGGADRTMREAITALYLPQGNRTQPFMAPKQVAPLALASEASSSSGTTSTSSGPIIPSPPAVLNASTAINVPSVILPETQFWSLLGERRLMGEWGEWLRIAKKRIRNTTSDDEEEVPRVELDLGGISLGEAGCWAVSELLEVRAGQINQLNLNHALHPLRWSTKLSDSYGLRRLLRAAAGLQSLQSLSLTHCHLGREGGTLLAGFLASPSARTNLRALHLQQNLLGQNITTSLPSGELVTVHACPGLKLIVKALASLVDDAAALEYLNLSNNLIDPQGARVIAEYLAGRAGSSTVKVEEEREANGDLKESPSQSALPAASSSDADGSVPILLRTLILDANMLQDDGMIALASSLRVNTSLTRLSLRGTAESSCGVRGFVELAHSIGKYNRNLAELDLGNNPRLFEGSNAAHLAALEAEILQQQEEDAREVARNGLVTAGPRESSAALISAAAAAQLDRRSGLALSSMIYHSTNGTNESGDNLRSLRLDNTGLNDQVFADIHSALSLNQALQELDFSRNQEITEHGQSMLFSALARQGLVQSLKLTGLVLGQTSALRLADWLRHSRAVQELHMGWMARRTGPPIRDGWGQLRSETEEALQATDDDFLAAMETQQQTPDGELSELVLSTLAGSINVARSHQLTRLSLGALGSHAGSILSNLIAPLPVEESLHLAPFGGNLCVLNLGGNTWDTHTFALLAQAIVSQSSLLELRLHQTVLSDDIADPTMAYAMLMEAVLGNPSLALLDLSGTEVGSAGLEGMGLALLGPEGQGVAGAALQSLELNYCRLEEFAAAEEQGGSRFLASLQCDATSLTSLSLRGNGFSASELLRLTQALDANWNLRSLQLSEMTIRQGEDSLQLLRGSIAHAVSHGLSELALPTVKHPLAAIQTRDAVLSAIADGWRTGVAQTCAFVREHQRAPSSVLHQLQLDVGASFRDAPVTWQQKQKLLESIRPLSQSSTVAKEAEESFRLVQLTAAHMPIRINTQQHVRQRTNMRTRCGASARTAATADSQQTHAPQQDDGLLTYLAVSVTVSQSVCGVDVVENALAARLACQRM